MPPSRKFGPPVPGAPWAFPAGLFGRGGATPTGRAVVPGPPDPLPSGVGVRRPFLPVVPQPQSPLFQQRLREHTQIMADCFNSLVRKGQVVQEGVADWTLNAEGLTGGGLTGTFNEGVFSGGDATDDGSGGLTGTFDAGAF